MAKRKNQQFIATVGRRKRAVARVRLKKGKGSLVINNKQVTDPHPAIVEPLVLTGTEKKVDISIKVVGGGLTGQAEAMRHGIARALVELNHDFKKTLKKAGLLTRDPREKERKKPGLKRARRAPQWAKR